MQEFLGRNKYERTESNDQSNRKYRNKSSSKNLRSSLSTTWEAQKILI